MSDILDHFERSLYSDSEVTSILHNISENDVTDNNNNNFNYQNNQKNSISAYRKEVEEYISNCTFQTYFSIAQLYYDVGDLHKALQYYHKAIEIKPHHFTSHFQIASIYQTLGMYNKAIQSWNIIMDGNVYDDKNYGIERKLYYKAKAWYMRELSYIQYLYYNAKLNTFSYNYIVNDYIKYFTMRNTFVSENYNEMYSIFKYHEHSDDSNISHPYSQVTEIPSWYYTTTHHVNYQEEAMKLLRSEEESVRRSDIHSDGMRVQVHVDGSTQSTYTVGQNLSYSVHFNEHVFRVISSIRNLVQMPSLGFPVNIRSHTVFGFGTLQMTQFLRKFIRTTRKSDSAQDARFDWSGFINIGISWRTYIDILDEVWWLKDLYRLQTMLLDNHQNIFTPIITCDMKNSRYVPYFNATLKALKKSILQNGFTLANNIPPKYARNIKVTKEEETDLMSMVTLDKYITYFEQLVQNKNVEYLETYLYTAPVEWNQEIEENLLSIYSISTNGVNRLSALVRNNANDVDEYVKQNSRGDNLESYGLEEMRWLLGPYDSKDKVEENKASKLHGKVTIEREKNLKNYRKLSSYSIVISKCPKKQGSSIQPYTFGISHGNVYDSLKVDLDMAFNKLILYLKQLDEVRQAQINTDANTDIELQELLERHIIFYALKVYYYWIHCGPLSRGNAMIGLMIFHSILLSIGKTYSHTPIPRNKQLDWEAALQPNFYLFYNQVKTWFCNVQDSATDSCWLEGGSDCEVDVIFDTPRKIIEMLSERKQAHQ